MIQEERDCPPKKQSSYDEFKGVDPEKFVRILREGLQKTQIVFELSVRLRNWRQDLQIASYKKASQTGI